MGRGSWIVVRTRTRTTPVVDRGSWIANSWYGLRVAVLCSRGSLAVLGCEFVIWVAGGVLVDRWLCCIANLWYGLRVLMDRWLCWVVNSWYGLRVVGGVLVDRWLCWVANSWYGLRVVVDRWLCSVVLGCRWLFWFLGWRDMVLGGCFTVVLVFCSAMERQRWEMRDRGERVR